MNEIERVAQMVADGRITAEEGDRLIAVLRSVQAADQQLEATRARLEDPEPATGAQDGADADPTSPHPLPAAPPPAPLPPVGATVAAPEAATAGSPPAQHPPLDHASGAGAAASQAATGGAAQPTADYAPPGTRWVRVELVAGNLDVKVDPSLSVPTATSDSKVVALEPTDYGYRLGMASPPGVSIGFFGKFKTGDFELVLPAGYGLELAKTAGDIDLHGVPYLRGTLAAGDLDAHGLEGIDFTTLAGDVFVSLAPKRGRHRVHAKVGEIEAVLLPGSDVSVKGDVSMGDITAGAPFATERSLVSERVTGAIGAGTASLELKVTAGSIELRSGQDE